MTMVIRSQAREGGSAFITSPLEFRDMTSSFPQPQQSRRQPSPAAAAVIGVITVVVVFTLITAAFTFAGLAIAFPIAVPIAEAYHLPIRVGDAALAQTLAGFWWVFAGLAIASLVGAVVTAVKAVQFLSPGD